MPLYRATYIRKHEPLPKSITYFAKNNEHALAAYHSILEPPGVITLTLQRCAGRYTQRKQMNSAPGWSWERTLPHSADGKHGEYQHG